MEWGSELGNLQRIPSHDLNLLLFISVVPPVKTISTYTRIVTLFSGIAVEKLQRGPAVRADNAHQASHTWSHWANGT